MVRVIFDESELPRIEMFGDMRREDMVRCCRVHLEFVMILNETEPGVERFVIRCTAKDLQ